MMNNNKETNKIYIYPSDFRLFTAETHYGITMARQVRRPVKLIDFETIFPSDAPNASVTAGAPPVPGLTAEQLQAEAEAKMAKLRTLAQYIWKEVQYEVEIGSPEPSVAKKLDEESPYLLVLGRYGDLDLAAKWFGTFESRLARKISCPVLIVPGDSTVRDVQQVVYVTENFAGEKEQVDWLVQLAQAYGAKITIADVIEGKDSFEPQFETFKSYFNTSWKYHHLDYFPLFLKELDRSFESLIRARNADLLAFQSREQGLFKRLAGGDSDIHRILTPDIPVLVF